MPIVTLHLKLLHLDQFYVIIVMHIYLLKKETPLHEEMKRDY